MLRERTDSKSSDQRTMVPPINSAHTELKLQVKTLRAGDGAHGTARAQHQLVPDKILSTLKGKNTKELWELAIKIFLKSRELEEEGKHTSKDFCDEQSVSLEFYHILKSQPR